MQSISCKHVQSISRRRIVGLALVMLVVVLAVPASSSAQATRTWVSGVGDDANPCSRTAPCKTFAGAISKTAAKGEINCLDPGGFGGVTITKTIAIECENTEGGVLVSGTNAIVVNAAATDRVILRGLDINGIGTGLNGIRILQARSVKIDNAKIFGFVRNGVDFEPSNANAKLLVEDSRIVDNNGNGVMVAPPASGAGARGVVRRSVVADNACGAVASSNIPSAAFNFAVDCGTSFTNGGSATLRSFRSLFSDNADAGVFSNGASSLNVISDNEIVGNLNGLRSINSGNIHSFGNNRITGNNTDGNTSGTLTPR